MGLLRATAENGLYATVEDEWSRQCVDFGEDFQEYATPSMTHAREIIYDRPCLTYGIYVLRRADHHDCLAHCNVARLPATTGVTLRTVWALLAPRFDFQDPNQDELADIAADLVTETLRLAEGGNEPGMAADHVKIHFNGTADRRYFAGAAHVLQRAGTLRDVAIRGNWLHMSIVNGLTRR